MGWGGQERERERWGREGQDWERESTNNHKSFLFCHL